MGGGGGSGGFYASVPSSELQHQISSSAEKLAGEFDDQLQRLLNEVLPSINDRDVEQDNRFKDQIKAVLSEELDIPIVNLTFQGSVKKNTYVEGISDVDCMAVFKELSVARVDPATLLNSIKRSLENNFPYCTVRQGNVAVTVTREDGSEFQIIPTVGDKGYLRVPSWDGARWSKIEVNKFRKTLTSLNDKLGMKLIPTIKLAKKVISQLPESKQLSGYHIESLAIEVFKKYDGEKKTSKMITTFFSESSKSVLIPIKDKSGQSRHVDDYLGTKSSSMRMAVSHLLNRLYKRMINASATKSSTRWKDILGDYNGD